MANKTDALKVICIWCNAEQNAEVIAQLDSVSEGCSSCGYGAEAIFTIEIKCCACNKVIYKKECTEDR